MVGLVEVDHDGQVAHLPGRRRLFRVRSGPSDVVLKQFPPGDTGTSSFRNEVAVYDSIAASVPSVTRLLVDDIWQIIATTFHGESLWLRLLRGDTVADETCELAVEAMTALHRSEGGLALSSTGLPAVVSWLLGEWPYERPSSSQVQIIQTLRAQPALREAAKSVAGMWTADNVIHGDAKLEHITLVGTTPLLLDFETGGYGWPVWDHAGLAQSALTFVVRVGAQEVPRWAQRLIAVAAEASGHDDAVFGATVAVRLAQTAYEWEHEQRHPSLESARLAQLATSVAADPGTLKALR